MSDEQSKLEPSGPQKLRFWIIFVLLSMGWGLLLGDAFSIGHSHKLGLAVGDSIIIFVAMRLSAWAVSVPLPEHWPSARQRKARLLRWWKGGRVDLADRVR